jgi:hypothetical protein
MRTLAATLALTCAAPAAAQLYKCVGADGKTAYQADPCASGARQSSVERQETSGVTPGPGPIPVAEVARVVAEYRACALSSEFVEANGHAFEQWRTHHAAAYKAFEADAAANQRVSEKVEAATRTHKTMGATQAMHRCEEVSRMLAVPRRGPEPDYFEVFVTYNVCRRVANPYVDPFFTSWMRRNQSGFERFRRENAARIQEAIDQRAAQFARSDEAAKSRVRESCKVELTRWLQAA